MGRRDSGEILESWKEIASYLGITVRTAQNWERGRGLPVHRDGDGPRARVSAYSRELDAWKSERTVRVTAPRKTPSFRWIAISAPALLAILVSLLYFAATTTDRSAAGLPAASRFVDNTLEVLDSHGNILWLKQLRDSVPSGQSRSAPGTLVYDVDRDGRNEILAALGDKPNGLPGRLVCFNSGGALRWTKGFTETLHEKDRTFSEFYVKWFTLLHRSERDYLIVAFANAYFPSATLLLDPGSGREIGSYLHPGHFEVHILLDVDADDRDELLLGGVNNPNEGFGFPALAVLKIPFSPPDPGTPNLFDLPGGQEMAYLLFPRCDGDAGQPGLQQVSSLFSAGSDRIMVGFAPLPSYYVSLSYGFHVVDVRPRNEFVTLHSRLFHTGILDHALSQKEIEAFGRAVHRFSTAADGNSPKVRSLMQVKWNSGD